MTRTMFDSTNPFAIPVTAGLVAGYVDGIFVWTPAAWARFPNAVHVRIAVFASTNDGHVLDVERGDASPAEAPGWVRMRRAAGADPSIYCNASTWPAVQAEFARQGVAQPHYWIAHYGAGSAIPAGAIAIQYADPPNGSGGQWDISAVADFWPGVDQGGTMAVLGTDDHTGIQGDIKTVLAGDWRFDNRNVIDMLRQIVATGFANQANLAQLAGALSTEEAAILATVQGADTDTKAGIAQLATAISSASGATVSVPTLVEQLAGPLATALGPLLPPETTAAQLVAALAAQLTK